MKLDSGAVLVNVTTNIQPNTPGVPPAGLDITVPLVFDVNLATLLQAQLGESLGVGANATIFEICAAIDAGTTLDINTVLANLTLTLRPIINTQINGQITNIANVPKCDRYRS